MAEWKQKRFWTKATAAEAESGFEILLDERPLRTPMKAPLVVPTLSLAQTIATEWDAQVEVVKPLTMPFTRSANAAIDKVSHQHAEVAELVAEYGGSDLLCYRAAGPDSLVARQAKFWDPLLEWAEHGLGAPLFPVVGVMHVAQSDHSLSVLKHHVFAMTPFELIAFHDLVSLSGSLIIGLAATQNLMPTDTLWQISKVDETWQAEQWGIDEEAEELAETKRLAFIHAQTFFKMVEKTSQAHNTAV
jgi:chaperone required for assembly of F1-ATPase